MRNPAVAGHPDARETAELAFDNEKERENYKPRGVKDQVKLGSRVRPGVLSRLVLYTAGQALVSQSINYPQRG
jgi:hypothetical protein